ncbi:MAG: hypothetical protein GEU80_01605 [Dehalococcoidia bacterium]|nr:hypothetical protein [Dehalococcoidia bacterium]
MNVAEQRYFEDVWPGDEFSQQLQPTAEDVAEFFSLTARDGRAPGRGNSDGRFSDAAGARRQGLERPIVPGNMSMAIITRLVTDWIGAYGRLQSLEVSFRRPVLHEDRITATALVTDALDDLDQPRVTLDVYLANERGERPVQGAAVVELPRRGPAAAQPLE